MNPYDTTGVSIYKNNHSEMSKIRINDKMYQETTGNSSYNYNTQNSRRGDKVNNIDDDDENGSATIE